MKTLSAPTYPDANIDTLAATTETPHDIAALRDDLINGWKEQWDNQLMAPVSRRTREQVVRDMELAYVVPTNNLVTMAELMAAFHERRRLADAKWVQKTTLRSNFGRWLQDDEKRIVSTAKEGLESIEDRLSVLPYVVEKIRSRKAWKAEQNLAQDPTNYADESLHYDLPPRVKGKSHVPAYYSITGPSGRTIDLSQPQGAYAPVLSRNPNDAFRRFLTRMGVDRKGGEVEILNLLLKADKVTFTNPQGEVSSDYRYLPSYVSSMRDGVWYVMVGWRLNPKCQYGTAHRDGPDGYVMPYVENAAGELEPFIVGVHSEADILTTSQLDYKLICEDSGLAIEDKDGDVVDYLNEDEELIMQGMIREDDHADDEMDSFLLTEAAVNMDQMIDLRIGSAVWLVDDFIPCIALHAQEVRSECQKTRKLLRGVQTSLNEFAALALSAPELADPETGKMLAKEREALRNKLRFTVERWQNDRNDLFAQMVQHGVAPAIRKDSIGTPRSTAPDAFTAPLPATVNVLGDHPRSGTMPVVIAGASNEPRNQIDKGVAREVDSMPAHRNVQFSWLSAVSPKLAAKRERMNRKAQVLASVEAGTLAVELAFASAFENALGLR